MNMTSLFRLVLATAVLAGCVTQPQLPVTLTHDTIAKSGKIGVAMTALPKQDTQVPGASCLLCLAFASASMSGLTSHAQTLSYEELPNLKIKAAELLRKKGATVVVIDDAIDINALPNNTEFKEGDNSTRKNFGSLQKKYDVDKLLLINITAIGFIRNYSAYIPTGDPQSLLQGTGYLVDLRNNKLDWYKPVTISKSAGSTWDEPPKYPGLTNAYFQTLELGMDEFLKPIANPAASVSPAVANPAAKP
jgi:hypothetical protein